MGYRSKKSLDNRAGNKHAQDNSHIFQPLDRISMYNVVRFRRASVPLVHVNMAERHKAEENVLVGAGHLGWLINQ